MSGEGGLGPQVARKWRPRIGLVVFAVLATVLSLPLAGIFFFRIYENQLVRETEAELIAQSAALAALFKQEIQAQGRAVLGARVEAEEAPDEFYRPIPPTLDLARGELLPRRPSALPASAPPDPALAEIGGRLQPIFQETQRVTLAGFRLLDSHGVVIAGREEAGLSLSHVEEVGAALGGRFRSVMRLRASTHEPPPIYSMSRGTGLRIFTAMPVILRDRVAGVVYASRTPSNVFRNLYEERAKVAAASFTILAAAVAIGAIFHRAITRPVRELILRTRAIAGGDRGALRPLTHHGTAEFAQLSQSFLDMAASLQSRSDFIATFAAHVSHELKSPLTSIRGAAELLRDDIGAPAHAMNDEVRRRFLDNIAADARRLTAIVNRLRDLARAEQPPTSGACALASIIAGVKAAFPMLDVRFSGDADQLVRISEENARIVFSHLADNSVRHGALRLEIDAERKGRIARVIVRDDGAGISPNNRSRIFDSFFTTRRDSGGTGMGLSIVRAMVLAHRGAIHVICVGEGAAFELTLPIADESDV